MLAALVVVGIAAIVIAVHMTGGSRPARLTSEAHARRRFAEDFPDETVSDVALTDDGAAAFLMLGGGRMGIVHAFGDRFLTRILQRGDVAAMEADGDSLRLRMRDFTWKGGAFRFPDSAAAARIRRALEPLESIGAE
jgi:hypothetical protein